MRSFRAGISDLHHQAAPQFAFNRQAPGLQILVGRGIAFLSVAAGDTAEAAAVGGKRIRQRQRERVTADAAEGFGHAKRISVIVFIHAIERTGAIKDSIPAAQHSLVAKHAPGKAETRREVVPVCTDYCFRQSGIGGSDYVWRQPRRHDAVLEIGL